MREVWLYVRAAFRLLTLRSPSYEQIAQSEVFPELDFAQLARFVPEEDQHGALKAYRTELRAKR